MEYCPDGKGGADTLWQIAEVFHVEHSRVIRITMRRANKHPTRALKRI